MTLKQAIAPVVAGKDVPCGKPHTTQTYLIGRLPLLRDGHLLAVDSPDVQRGVGASCREALAGYVGGSDEDRRLSMVRAVWFTPTVDEANDGADWFRCDVVAMAGGSRLSKLPRDAKDLVAATDRFDMCGTAAPDAKGFVRVPCQSRHSWVAVATVDLGGTAYPSAATADGAMDGPCRAAAEARAGDPLDVTWSQERPSEEQWDAGQRYGICWAPA